MMVVIEISKARERRVGSVTARRASHSVAPDTAVAAEEYSCEKRWCQTFIAEIEPTSRDLTLNLSLGL